ncbi:MAG TPA: hypothetical protein VM240_11640, partial [Verrucomicrobiae bacterium]|nr:hypothetical protein [Verrucomicrobiae bacterium]
RGDDLGDGPGFFFDPQVRTSTLSSVFAQDDIQLVPNRLAVVVGSKIEGNDFTGVGSSTNVTSAGQLKPADRAPATPTCTSSS